MSAATTLYTREVLALATSLTDWPYDPDLPLQGSARSASCGSTIELGLDLAETGAVARLGLRARACAIGQASAAIFAAAAIGKAEAELASALASIESWLDGGPMPDWPGIAQIAAARDFPARRGAILLPWRAALVALAQRG